MAETLPKFKLKVEYTKFNYVGEMINVSTTKLFKILYLHGTKTFPKSFFTYHRLFLTFMAFLSLPPASPQPG